MDLVAELPGGLVVNGGVLVAALLLHDEPHVLVGLYIIKKKDLYRREGKGRRCSLGDRIAFNPCRGSHFSPVQVED